MMNEPEFRLYCDRLKISERGIAYLGLVRSSPPSRRGQSGGGNVVSRFPSRKMGATIQSESHHYELSVIYQLEYDQAVLELWEQPEHIQLTYQAVSGRITAPWHTPDFLVLKSDSVLWIEVKPEEKLQKLAVQQPNRYRRNAEGRWHCPPGEQVAAQYGFKYDVWSSTDTNPTLIQNLKFLDDYSRSSSSTAPAVGTQRVVELVNTRPGITIGEIRFELGAHSADAVFSLISAQGLYVDINRFSVQDYRTPIYSSKPLADALGLVAATGNRADNIGRVEDEQSRGPSEKPGPTENGGKQLNPRVYECITATSPKDLETATQRARILKDNDSPAALPIPERTVRRWRANFRRAEEIFGDGYGYLGLIPSVKDRGNREARLGTGVYKLASEVINQHYLTPKRISKWHAYGLFLSKCETGGVQPPSYKWFRKQILLIRAEEGTRAREGRRAAYKHQGSITVGSGRNDNHGQYPWHVVHVDHTEVDVEIVDEETGQNLGRPWLSLMFDGYSRRVLALYLTFAPPSSQSTMMLFRDCVRRHHRLPSNLVIDGGKEFGSEIFEKLTAIYEIKVHKRPAAQPRFGSVIEREFGTLNKQFFHNLAGNTQNTRNVRQLTKSVDPKNLAVWSLERLHALLSCFAFELYDRRPHPSLRSSPADFYARGIIESGSRPACEITYDDTFHFLTMPSTPKGTSKVQPGLGVKVFYMYFWHDAMRDPQWEGKQVRVRYDPDDIGVAYAFLGKTWVRCISAHHASVEGRSERQLSLAVQSIRRSRSKLEKERTITARELGDFFTSVHGEELLRLQRRKDLALRRTREIQSEIRASVSPQAVVEQAAALAPNDAPDTPENLEVFADF